jgi:hypothetical protein
MVFQGNNEFRGRVSEKTQTRFLFNEIGKRNPGFFNQTSSPLLSRPFSLINSVHFYYYYYYTNINITLLALFY